MIDPKRRYQDQFMLKHVDRKNINLLFTDTDSFCYRIKKTDIFEIMKNNMDEFYLSDYPKDHILYNHKNNKVIDTITKGKEGV